MWAMTASSPVRWATAFLDVTAAQQEPTEQFWLAVTETELSPRRGPGGEFVTFLPRAGEAYLRLQRVTERPGGIHLDLHSLDPDALADRAVRHGARVRHAEPGLIVLTSPGGQPWCAVERPERGEVPPPVAHAGSGRTRLDQVCLDCPPELAGAELEFWAAVTGWERFECQSPEFELLRPPDGTPRPVQLLLQRIDDAPAPARSDAPRVSAHLDLAAGPSRGDRLAAVAAHESLGASRVFEGRAWTVLRAPGGVTYCLTDRDPATGLG